MSNLGKRHAGETGYILIESSESEDLLVAQEYEEMLAERVETAAELYWLQGMDLGYAKRRALVEATRGTISQRRLKFPVIQLGG